MALVDGGGGSSSQVLKTAGLPPAASKPVGSSSASTSATGTAAAVVEDRAATSGSTAYGSYASGSAAESGSASPFWGGLLSSAKSMWGTAERYFGVAGSSSASGSGGSSSGTHAAASHDHTGSVASTDPTAAYNEQIKAEITKAKAKQQADDDKWNDPSYEHAQMMKYAGKDAIAQLNAKVPLTGPQQVVYKTLAPSAQQAYQQLSTDQRDQFDAAYRAVGGLWASQNQYSSKAETGLQNLLTNGQLLSKDTEGNTMLSDLAARAGSALAPQLQGKNVDATGQLQNIVNMVAYPDQIYQGDNTNVCVSASLQTLMANSDPAELVRITAGLVFDGQVKLHGTTSDHDVLTLNADELNTVDGGRSTTSELIQGSFDAYGLNFAAYPPGVNDGTVGGGRGGSSGGAGGGRSGMTGSAGGGRSGMVGAAGNGRSGMVGAAGSGNSNLAGSGTSSSAPAKGSAAQGYQLTEFQAQQLYQHVDGNLAVPVFVNGGNRQTTVDGALQSLQNGTPVPAEVPGYDAKGQRVGNHQITLLQISPDGTQVQVQDSSVGKAAWVPISEVEKNLEAVVLPAQYAANTDWQISPNPQNPGDANGAGGGRSGMGGAGG